MTKYRYIGYTGINMPCNESFELSRFESLRTAEIAYRDFCNGVHDDNCTTRLYDYSDEAWESAKEFENVGCPFDYPEYLIERGPLNGVKIVHA